MLNTKTVTLSIHNDTLAILKKAASLKDMTLEDYIICAATNKATQIVTSQLV